MNPSIVNLREFEIRFRKTWRILFLSVSSLMSLTFSGNWFSNLNSSPLPCI